MVLFEGVWGTVDSGQAQLGFSEPMQFGTFQFPAPVLTFVFLMFVSNLTTREGLLRVAVPGASIPGNLRE